LIIVWSTSIPEKGLHWNGILEFLDENIVGRPNLERSWEGDRNLPLGKVVLENDQILHFVTKIELSVHHRAKDLDLLRKRNPLHAREQRYGSSKEVHDGKIARDHLGHSRMKNLDGNRSCGDRWGRILKDYRGESAGRSLPLATGPEI
jgi:hypothetical protein